MTKLKVIVAMGSTAVKALTGQSFVSRCEGTMAMGTTDVLAGIEIMPAYHPAAVLRNPKLEKNLASAIWVAAETAGLRLKRQRFDEVFPYESFD